MKRFLPKSLAGQTILVLLAGLTVSHIISITIYSGDRVEALSLMGWRHMAQRIANITHLIGETPPEWRERIVTTLDDQTFRVSISPESMLTPQRKESWQTRVIANFVNRQLQDDHVKQVIVRLVAENDSGQGPGRNAPGQWNSMMQMMHSVPLHQTLRISIKLNGDQWLNFGTAIPEASSFWSSTSVLSMLSMALAVVLLSVWVVRRLTAPLGAFAMASERLGRDVNAPPMSETGPVELRQASRAFNKMQERLTRLIDNRTRMLAAISHDLRTPITLLRLRSELIEDSETRTRIMQTLEDMETIISSTLTFAREDAEMEETRTVDVAALLESICNDMADAGLPVELSSPESVLLDCRPGAMKRALNNLINNAVKYGGNARVGMNDKTDHLAITIEDDGPGIPSEELKHVFAPFYRLEPSRSHDTGGIGLGLSIAQTVIHAHGGEIVLTNREEGGLQVYIVLPR